MTLRITSNKSRYLEYIPWNKWSTLTAATAGMAAIAGGYVLHDASARVLMHRKQFWTKKVVSFRPELFFDLFRSNCNHLIGSNAPWKNLRQIYFVLFRRKSCRIGLNMFCSIGFKSRTTKAVSVYLNSTARSWNLNNSSFLA